MKRSLTKAERLKSRDSFTFVFDKPDFQASCRGAKIVIRSNNLDRNRFAPALIKKYGNSVKRNYAKRAAREVYRNMKENFPSGYDIIFVMYPGNYSYWDRKQQFETLIRRSDFVR